VGDQRRVDARGPREGVCDNILESKVVGCRIKVYSSRKTLFSCILCMRQVPTLTIV
jgi:hypothetical protein